MTFFNNITSPRNLNEICVPAGETGRSSPLLPSPSAEVQSEDPAEDADETDNDARHACRPSRASPEPLPDAATPTQTLSGLVTAQRRCVTRGRLRRVTRRLRGVGPPRLHQRGRLGPPRHELRLSSGQCQGRLPSGICRLRLEEQRFAHLASDYEEEVMVYMLEVEGRHLPHPSIPASPPSVTTATRTTLVHWLIHLQRQLGAPRWTVYHSLALVERVVAAAQHPPAQLLAIAALLIVSKLEETKPLQTSDLLRVALEQHTHAELLALERRVLKLLQFRLTSADPAFFLNYFLHLTCNSHDQLVVECCWLLMETGLVETSLLHTRPSLMAAAALYGSLRVMHGTLAASVLPAVIPNYFRLEERTVLATTTTLLEALSAVACRTPHSPTEGDGSPSWGSALSQHPRLAPDNLLLLVQQLRTRLSQLSRATTICHALSSRHSLVSTSMSCTQLRQQMPEGTTYSLRRSVEIADYRTENPLHEGNTENNIWQDKEVD